MDVCFRLNNMVDGRGGWRWMGEWNVVVSHCECVTKTKQNCDAILSIFQCQDAFFLQTQNVRLGIHFNAIGAIDAFIHSWIRACSSHTSPDPTRLRMKTWKCCNSINIYPSPINKHDCPPLIPEGVKHKYWVTLQWMYYWRHDTTTTSLTLSYSTTTSTEVLDDQSSCSDASQVSQPATPPSRSQQKVVPVVSIGQRNYCNTLLVKWTEVQQQTYPSLSLLLLLLLAVHLGSFSFPSFTRQATQRCFLFMPAIWPCYFLIPNINEINHSLCDTG